MVNTAYGEAGATPYPFADFESFFRATYEPLIRHAMRAGASHTEATDAVGQAMEDVLRQWDEIDQPVAYARRAVISNFIKAKERQKQLRQRLVTAGGATPEAAHQVEFNLWEDDQVVSQLLDVLSPEQRRAIRGVMEGLTSQQMADLYGQTAEAVRQNLRRARQRLKSDRYVQEAQRRQRLRLLKTRRKSPVQRDEPTPGLDDQTGEESV